MLAVHFALMLAAHVALTGPISFMTECMTHLALVGSSHLHHCPCRLMFCFFVNTCVDAQLWVAQVKVVCGTAACVRSTLACATTAVCGWYTLGWRHGGSVQKEVDGRWYVTTDPWSGWQTWGPPSSRFVSQELQKQPG